MQCNTFLVHSIFYCRPYLEAIFHALECTENDYEALFALCLLYAMGHNEGIEFFSLHIFKRSTQKNQYAAYENRKHIIHVD